MIAWIEFRSRVAGALSRPMESLTLTQKLVFSGALVGASSGVAIFLFTKLIELLMSLTVRRGLALPAHSPLRWALILLLPALGALAGAALIAFCCPEAGGHGIAEVSQAASAAEGEIPGRVAWVKLLAAASTIGLGGSAGREGPAIHIGGAVGSWIGRRLGLAAKDVGMLVGAGASAGLAAAFGVPLTAVLFTMEVITRDFASDSFVAVLIASVSGAVTSRLLVGGAEYTLHAYGVRGPMDFLWFALVALICAPLGRLYMRSIETVEHEAMPRWWGRRPAWLAPAVGGLAVGAVALFVPEVMGTGNDFIVGSINGTVPSGWRAALLALAKIGATASTLGTGGSGGAFMPALFIGAAAGGFCHTILGAFAPEAGGLALAGMACVVTAAYRAPFTGIVMALEMSRDYDILAPVMLACAISFALSQRPAAQPVVER